MIDLSDPTLHERLYRRTAEGRYEIGESELVVTIRTQKSAGNNAGVRYLCEILVTRCAPAFQRHSQGLRHRPDLREEAIANMGLHLLREAQDPTEIFITQNFIHYLRCLCADEFNRILRQEGLGYRRDAEGRPLVALSMYQSALLTSCVQRLPMMRFNRYQMSQILKINTRSCMQRMKSTHSNLFTRSTGPQDHDLACHRGTNGMI